MLALIAALPAEPRGVSSPPRSASARSILHWEANAGELDFGMYNPGDYDQNGVVNISDLTPLAMHFMESVPTGDPDSILAVVDGDGNGIINISDVTPIGANFGNALSGYRVYFEASDLAIPASDSAPSSAVPMRELPLSEALGNRAFRRLHFVMAIDLRGGEYCWARPFAEPDGSEGSLSQVIGGGNQAPDVCWSIDPLTGSPPLSVMIDASASTDPDGDDLTFRWDPDFNGILLPGESSLPLEFVNNLQRSIGLLVEDPGGFGRYYRIEHSTGNPPAWHAAAVLLLGSIPQQLDSVAAGSQGGKPWIYATSWDSQLAVAQSREIRAVDASGSKWGNPQLLTSSSSRYSNYIDTYHFGSDDTNGVCMTTLDGKLYYHRETEPATGSWAEPVLAVASGAGADCSLDLGFTEIYIAYNNQTTGKLDFVSADETTGTVWSSFNAPSVPAGSGSGPGLNFTLNGPALIYHDSGLGQLRYMDAWIDIDDITLHWRPSLMVASVPGGVRMVDSLLSLADLKPAVIFLDLDSGKLLFHRSQTFHDGDFNTLAELATGLSSSPEIRPRAAMAGGLAHVCYYDPSQTALMHVGALDLAGSGWSEPQIVDGDAAPEVIPYITSVGGNPAVAYADSTLRELLFAVFY
jgi:hypothetical protein